MDYKDQDLVQEMISDKKGKNLLGEIIEAIKGIRYGYVQITIHNSNVVQIDKMTRIRKNIKKS